MKLRNKETGQVGDLMGTERSCSYITIIIDFHDGNPRSFDYTSLAELNEEWEDFKPVEPLIKDEKIRKAVRAWAEACEIGSNVAIMTTDLAPALTRFFTLMYELDVRTESSLGLDEHRDYTIAELCGEE